MNKLKQTKQFHLTSIDFNEYRFINESVKWS